MDGVIVGGIFGMSFVAFMGAWRSVYNWRTSKDRPSRLRLYLQVVGQVGIALTALAFGIWFLIFGSVG